MALIKAFEEKRRDRQSIHDAIDATYSVFERGGRAFVQIDTYGRAEREVSGKVSQSLQFDEKSARELFDILRDASVSVNSELASRIDTMRYDVVIEKGDRNYSAYVPDLPGCASVGDTLDEVTAEIREAIEFHLEGMREDGQPISPPSNRAE
jgi:predicted RNase H-like HicB family nuclease